MYLHSIYIYICVCVCVCVKLLIHAQMIFGRIYSQNGNSGCLWEGELSDAYLRYRSGGEFFTLCSLLCHLHVFLV